MRRTLAIGALLALALGLSAGATAATPQKDFIDVSFPDWTCPGIDTFSLHGGVLIHALTPTEELQTFQNFTIAWNGNGKTLTSRGPATVRVTYGDAAHTAIVRSEVRGLLVAVTLPGQGAVFLETGLLVVAGAFPGSPVIFRHGPDGFRSPEDYEAFCAYFES